MRTRSSRASNTAEPRISTTESTSRWSRDSPSMVTNSSEITRLITRLLAISDDT